MKLNPHSVGIDFDYAELRSLVDRNADGILVVDDFGLVQFANAAALRLFGRGPERLIGLGLGLPLVAGETTGIDLLRPDGSALEVEMRVVETVWNGRQALLASLRDVSERRELEEQLRHSQKMEAVGRLTAGVAHDFNNLLTIVLGNLDTLRRRLSEAAIDPRLSRAVDNATTGARRAADLTHQLLAYSRRQPLTPKPVDLAALLHGMDDLLTRTLGISITISVELAPGTWPILVDASQLEAALINLAVNAKDAMASGGKLSIRVRNCAEADARGLPPGDFVCLSVSDTGTGIAPELAEQVFDPFFTTKDVGRGTGLGLSQVYGFIKQSQGHVTLESEVGTGTTVRLFLPRHDGVVEQASGKPPPPAPAPAGRTILLVEDEDDLREWARQSLEELGYTVVEAGSAAEALAILESDRPLLLMFSDLSLPGGMDGRRLARKAMRLRPKMRTLLTTAYAGDALVEDGRLASGIRLLSKPYTRNQLERAIASLSTEASPDVLLVEDDPAVRQTLADSLRELGCVVEEAATAKAAMDIIADRDRPLACAIIDLELPDGSGLALLQALRVSHPEAAAIVASGYIGENELSQIEADAGAVVLAKPFGGQDLRKVLVDLGLLGGAWNATPG